MKLEYALWVYLSGVTPVETHQLDLARKVIEQARIPIESVYCRDALSALSKRRLEFKKQGHYKH